MITELAILILICIIVYHLYVHKKVHYHFKRGGVRYRPGVPLFGNTFCSTFALRHVIEDIDAVYKAFPDEKYVGYLEGSSPVIIVRDPDLMKLITIKDFNHFTNRKPFFPKKIDPLIGSSVLNMKDDEWRSMRSRLTVAFSGAKMKCMLPSMTAVSNHIVEYLKDHQSEDIDVIDLMRCYSTDVIASTGFGVHINSVKERSNTFFTIGEETVTFTFWRKVLYFLMVQFSIVADLMQFLGVQLLPSNGTQFFRKVVSDTMAYRKANNIVRPDFIHLLMEASQDWSLDEITGQIYFSFLASYESTASSLTMCIHELALHPEYEEKLYQEISAYQEKFGELSFDRIAELKYLDCVLNESFRKWSVALMMDRVCSKTYVLPPPRDGGKEYVINPGDIIYSVVNPVHMDPKYHPDPEIFDPNRFSEDNKHNIKSFTFMPFGMGPRNCLGMRYTILKMKVLLYHLVLNYRIVRSKRTADPIQLQGLEFNIRAVGETYVRFEART